MSKGPVVDDVERLLAIEDICALKARYFRCMDERDWDGLAATMAPDLAFEHPTIGRHASAAAALEAVKERLCSLAFTVHQGGMPEIDVHSSEQASGIWSLHSVVMPQGAAGGRPALIHGYGRYFDEYRRIDGEWRISGLRLVHLYKGP